MVSINTEGGAEGLWGEGVLRVFISHVAKDKEFAAGLKVSLGRRGMASFVAHEDIEPMREWELEIERALFSMNVLVALLTEGFSESKWTDQEVGVAVGRRVPIVPIKMGKDPYGFMAKYQAIRGSDKASAVADEIFRYVLTNEDLRVFGNDVLVAALSKSGSFASSNSLSRFLEAITHLSPDQETALVGAFNENDQIQGAREVRGKILDVLKRATGNDYELGKYRLTKLPKSGEGQ